MFKTRILLSLLVTIVFLPAAIAQSQENLMDIVDQVVDVRLTKNVQYSGFTVTEVTEGAVPGSIKRLRLQYPCLLYTSPSPRDRQKSRMPSSA